MSRKLKVYKDRKKSSRKVKTQLISQRTRAKTKSYGHKRKPLHKKNINVKKESFEDFDKHCKTGDNHIIDEWTLQNLPGVVTPPEYVATPESSLKSSQITITSTPTHTKKDVESYSKLNEQLQQFKTKTWPDYKTDIKHVSFNPMKEPMILSKNHAKAYSSKWRHRCYLQKKNSKKLKNNGHKYGIITYINEGDLLPASIWTHSSKDI